MNDMEGVMQNIIHKIINRIFNIGRYLKYGKYQKKYGFNQWHMISKAGKPYIKEIVNYIKSEGIGGNTCIVECGCGLCDILEDKAFKQCQKVGVEKDKRVYDAICDIYHGKAVFLNGSFQEIKGMNIDWFIAVNFTHTISDHEMMMNLKALAEDNQVWHMVLDEVTGNYQYSHNYVEIVPEGYVLENTLGPYPSDGGKRYIKIFKNEK